MTLTQQLFAEQRGYRCYSASLIQEGSAIPTANVFENTLGEDEIVWERQDIGEYYGSRIGGFPQDKTMVFVAVENNTKYGSVAAYRHSTDRICVNTRDGNGEVSDDFLTRTSLEVRIYP